MLGQFVWAKAQREACLINETANRRGYMNNKIENSKAAISAPTQSTLKSECTKKHISQQKQQKFLQRIIAIAFVLQAALIGVRGNLDVLSGKPVLNVLQGMINQGIELIIKAQGVQKRLKKSDRLPRSDQ